jgi:hypothetical protein
MTGVLLFSWAKIYAASVTRLLLTHPFFVTDHHAAVTIACEIARGLAQKILYEKRRS